MHVGSQGAKLSRLMPSWRRYTSTCSIATILLTSIVVIIEAWCACSLELGIYWRHSSRARVLISDMPGPSSLPCEGRLAAACAGRSAWPQQKSVGAKSRTTCFYWVLHELNIQELKSTCHKVKWNISGFQAHVAVLEVRGLILALRKCGVHQQVVGRPARSGALHGMLRLHDAT